MYTPGDMLDSVLEKNQLGLLGEGHVVIIEVVLENSLNLIHVCQILVQTIFFVCIHLRGLLDRNQSKHRNQMLSELFKHSQ